ncbi:MAG: dATP/dGTP diphosphohydrolase domain-containing protein [Nitrospiraceae bacterium]
MAEAKKYDGEKIQMELFPWNAFIETCIVLTLGATTYDPGNWKSGNGFKYSRLIGAMLRHLIALALGQDKDPKSGRHHVGHLICEAAFLYETQLAGKGVDDRAAIQFFPKELIDMLMDPEQVAAARAGRAENEARAE